MQDLTNVCFYISIALISCSSANTNTRLNELPKVTDTIDIQKINKEFNRKVKKEISGFIGKLQIIIIWPWKTMIKQKTKMVGGLGTI